MGKKSRKFQQISDTKSCDYVRNLVRFGVNVISFEGGGRWFSLFDIIVVFGLNKESKAKFSPTFLPSSEKIKLPHGILGYFFSCYPDWEVGNTVMIRPMKKSLL